MSTGDTNTITLQDAQTPQKPSSSMQDGWWSSLVPMLLIFVVFYFLLIRPQDQKRRAQEQLVASVKKGEDIITHSGIYGTISKLNDSEGTAEITIAPDVTIKILKSAIANVIRHKQNETKPEKKKLNKA